MSTSGGTSGGGSGLQPANNLSDVASLTTSLDNLAQGVTAARFLRGDGTHIALAAIQAADVPTLNQNTTGTAASVTGTAANVTGTVAIANGGTGQTSAAAALAALGGAPIASPNFAGPVNISATASLTIGAPDVSGAIGAVGSICAQSGGLGLTFIATEYNQGAGCLDLRGTRGTSLAAPAQSLSGDTIAIIRGGGGTSAGFIDNFSIRWKATQDLTASAGGSKMEVYTVPNGSTTHTLALTIGQDQSVTFVGAISGITTLGMTGALSGATNVWTTDAFAVVPGGALGSVGLTAFAVSTSLTLRRANGSLGSETALAVNQTMGSFVFAGWNSANSNYLTGASIAALAEEAWTTTGFRGTRLSFSTALSATNSAAAVRLILDNAGKLWWGATTGAANAFVDQTGNASFGGTLAVTGATTLSSTVALQGAVTISDAINIAVGTTTGTKIGTATTQKLGFYNKAPVVQQTDGAALTNNVTSGGTTDTIANFTDLTIYANDSTAIRNDLYQLARKLKIVDDALRLYGLLS